MPAPRRPAVGFDGRATSVAVIIVARSARDVRWTRASCGAISLVIYFGAYVAGVRHAASDFSEQGQRRPAANRAQQRYRNEAAPPVR
jgi:hypothetical protein